MLIHFYTVWDPNLVIGATNHGISDDPVKAIPYRHGNAYSCARRLASWWFQILSVIGPHGVTHDTRPSRKTYLTVENLENPLLQSLSRLGSHEDVNDFQMGAGAEQLLHQHLAQEARGPCDEQGFVAVEGRDHGHDSSVSLLWFWEEGPEKREKQVTVSEVLKSSAIHSASGASRSFERRENCEIHRLLGRKMCGVNASEPALCPRLYGWGRGEKMTEFSV